MVVYILVYFLVAFAACAATLVEYQSKDDLSPWQAVLGVLACMVWPLTLVVTLLHMRVLGARQRRILLPV